MKNRAAITRARSDLATDAGSNIPRYAGLDSIRGLAILLVLGLHFGFYANFHLRAPSRVTELIAQIFLLGWSGVDLFFVLSGFLITSILLASKSEPHYFRKFYGRRTVRIFPLYYTVLVIGLFVAPALFGDWWTRFTGDTNTHQVWLWGYALNIGMTFGVVHDTGMFGPLWSLAVEEQYYLVWPWIVKFTAPAALGVICCLFIAGSLMFRLAWMVAGFGWDGANYFTLSRLDSLAVGGGIALLVQKGHWRRLDAFAPYGLTIGLIAVALMVLRFQWVEPGQPFVVTFGHSVLAIMFGCLVVMALRDPEPGWLRARWLKVLGKYSYGIYVWHWFAQRILAAQLEGLQASSRLVAAIESTAFVIIGLVISVFCGWASYVVIEQPFLRLKRLFRYERPAPARMVPTMTKQHMLST